MDDDPIVREAIRRTQQRARLGRRGSATGDHLYANIMGMRGEEAFADRFGIDVDLLPRRNGDGGRDFQIRLWTDTEGVMTFNVDCKAALHPKNLIVECGRCLPLTIYVLCQYFPLNDRCMLLGWQWGQVLLDSPPKNYGYGIINFWCPRARLRSLDELDARIV